MATYFKYAQRNAEDYIDWGAIGKTMSDTLLKEQLNRDMMKSEIDKASREFGEVLSNAPQGEHRGLNEYSQEFASNAQQYQLMQLRNLKAGKLSLKDYLIGRENLKQGANDAFDIIKKYNDKYGEYQQRVEDGVASNYQTFLLGEVEGFGNLTNTSLYINPTNGKVSAGKRVLRDPSKPYDPVNNPYTAQMSDDPNDFRSLVDLNFALSAQIDKYDANAAIDDIANKYDNTYEVLTKGKRGEYTVIDDITQMGEDGKTFKESLEQDLKARFLTNPIHTISSLVDWLQEGPDGEPIEFTRNPAEANAHTILLKPNPEQPEGGTDVMDKNAEGAQELIDHLIKTTANSVITQLNKKVRYQRGFQPQVRGRVGNVSSSENKRREESDAFKYFELRTNTIKNSKSTKFGPTQDELRNYAADFGVEFIEAKNPEGQLAYFINGVEYGADNSILELVSIVEGIATANKDDIVTGYKRKAVGNGGGMSRFN